MRASAGVVQAAEASTVTGARHPRSRCAAAAPRSRSRVDKGGAGLVGRRRRRRQVEPRPRDAQRAGQVGGLQHDRRGARREGVERVARREAKRVAKAGQERLIALVAHPSLCEAWMTRRAAAPRCCSARPTCARPAAPPANEPLTVDETTAAYSALGPQQAPPLECCPREGAAARSRWSSSATSPPASQSCGRR